ncbi:MAG: sodium/solute symporter [Candidatus Marinimicrobia bacterium]|nr:sodium/solute symporter [Candidatus Neomarinimicrobiota bacterium]
MSATTHFLTPLNLAVMGIYLLGLLVIGLLLARRQQSFEDFSLGGRRLPWLLVAMSMYASVTSAMTFLGLPGLGYQGNISLIIVSIMSPLIAPVLIFGFYPLYRRLGLTTSYEYIAGRFGPHARIAVATLFLLARLGWLGTVIYAPALALSTVTGLPLSVTILLMGLVATGYTVLGGLTAVVWTDAIQFLIMIVGAVWVAVSLLNNVPGGFDAIRAQATVGGGLAPGDWAFEPTVMNALAVACAYYFLLMQDYGVDQVTVQRLLAVKTNRGVTRAILFNATTDFLIIGLLLFIGLGLAAFAAATPNAIPADLAPERVLPWFIVTRLPPGLSGLVITAVIAAAMSSMDSGINSMATVVLHDLVRPNQPRWDSARQGVRQARALTLLLGLLSTGLAFGVARIGGIIKAFYTFMGYFSAPVLALFLLGLLTRRARFGGWLIGAACALFISLHLQRTGQLHEIYLFPLGVLLTGSIGYLASLLMPQRRPPTHPLSAEHDSDHR